MARGKAPATEADASFPFVVSNGPRPPVDPAVRTMIRRQAMKDAGARRKRANNHGRNNTGQVIVACDGSINCQCQASDCASATASTTSRSTPSLNDTSTLTRSKSSALDTDATDSEHSPSNWLVAQQSPSPKAAMSRALSIDSAYERTRARYGIDLSMLTILTDFNIGKSTLELLAADPIRLPNILFSDPRYSFLPFVASRYSSSRVLAATTDSLLHKVCNTLAPQLGSEAGAMKLYAKALHTLQEAIMDPVTSTDADVLCAIQMLSIHELLDPTRDAAWSSHVKGSVRLVKHRSSHQFQGEYEKALFAGHVGPVVSEALFSNEVCYLEEPQWAKLYMSLVQESGTLTDRSELVINQRKIMFSLPRLWLDVGDAVMGEQLFDDGHLSELGKRCRAQQAEYLEWLENYKSYCVARSLSIPTSRELELRRECFGAAVECLVLVKRLLACVCDSERLKLEPEVQALAKLLIEMQDQPSSTHSWLFTGHQVGVAQVAVATKVDFEHDTSSDSEENPKLSMRKRYIAWSGTLRGV